MEKLLQYVWKHKILPLHELRTTDGRIVEVLDPGLQNINAGPDFINAKVKIDGILWAGNIEVHERSSQWYQHGHDKDPKYDNVILHVVERADCDVLIHNADTLTQLELKVPEKIKADYDTLLLTDKFPPCYEIIPSLSDIMMHSWLAALQTERLEQKTVHILETAERCIFDWEKTYFVTLSRNFGFGVNGDVFEEWASNINLSTLAHHKDNLMQIEAMFFGQAGLLGERTYKHDDGYAEKLRQEYKYLSEKFGLTQIDGNKWNFLRTHPQNFPDIRISQLANLYCDDKTSVVRLMECADADDLKNLFRTHITAQWGTPCYNLSSSSVNLLAINTAVPIMFAYGRYRGDELLCDKALSLLDTLKSEDNHITRMWKQAGIEARTAGDSQALIQLKKEYCDKKDCLRCRIGYEYLKI